MAGGSPIKPRRWLHDFPESDRLWALVHEIEAAGDSCDPLTVLKTARDRGIDVGWQHLNALYATLDDVDEGERIPLELVDFLNSYLAGRPPVRALDPWCGNGVLLAALAEKRLITSGVGITHSLDDLELAQLVGRDYDIAWQFGEAFDLLDAIAGRFDLVVSCLPGAMPRREWRTQTGQRPLRVRDEEGFMLLLKACTMLHSDGEAVVFLPTDRLVGGRSRGALAALPKLGLAIHAVLAIPDLLFPGMPSTVSLVFIRRGAVQQWFVGQIADSPQRNAVLLENVHTRRSGADAGLGRLVAPADYGGYPALAAADRVERMAQRLGLRGVPLGTVARINPVLPSIPPGFAERPNCVYLPRGGQGEAVVSYSDLAPDQVYLQLVLDPQVAQAEYVARFLNTPLGLAIREQATVHTAVPAISKRALGRAQLFLPDYATQQQLLGTETLLRTVAAKLRALEQELWDHPQQHRQVRAQLAQIARVQLRGERFTDWLDTLPFPLATILWTYHASSGNPRAQYEHLREKAGEPRRLRRG